MQFPHVSTAAATGRRDVATLALGAAPADMALELIGARADNPQ